MIAPSFDSSISPAASSSGDQAFPEVEEKGSVRQGM
jgi:hypothetical protein